MDRDDYLWYAKRLGHAGADAMTTEELARITRDSLLKRGRELGHKAPDELTDDQLESWTAETEMSADFWERWDADIKRELGTDDIYVVTRAG